MTRLIGDVGAGDRAAAFYTLLGNCRQLEVNAYDYLLDLFTRLPSLTNQRIREMTPAAWAARNKAPQSLAAASCQAADKACLV